LPNSTANQHFTLEPKGEHICARFSVMASPCELLIDSDEHTIAYQLASTAYGEGKRIEQKFSRYISDNLMSRINNSNGQAVFIDDETHRLLVFANTCFELSQGMFDLSSGVLRRIWTFDGSDFVPTASQVSELLPFVGWKNIKYSAESITLPKGFELDFGGIGKEYAVDSVAKLCSQQQPRLSVLVNFGGDIQVTQPRVNGDNWQVGIEDPNHAQTATRILNIKSGGLATSGDARRFLLKDGVRYSHILNPHTGYPISHAARSITVAANHCIQAGLLATLALLQGVKAKIYG
jgi:thiamine biosynthesis lipoprotein